MAYRIAGIDVHKRMLAVVIADITVQGEYEFERRRVGTRPSELSWLAEWLVEQEVEEVVMDRRRSIGDRCGWRWNGLGDLNGKNEMAPVRCLGLCTWHRRNRIADRLVGRKILQMANGW